jgi:flagellar biogenesis protein FliO
MMDDSLLHSFLSLVGLVAVLGIALYLVKRYAKKAKKKANSIELELISKLPVQPKTNLFIIKAGPKTLLIGASDHNITTLADLTEDKQYKIPAATITKSQLADLQKTKISKAYQPVQAEKKEEIQPETNPLSFKNFLRSSLKKN